MPSYAEHLGIDLDKLEAERHHYYPRLKYSNRAISGEYGGKAITPPLESSEDWQRMTSAAKAVGRRVETIRRWVKSDLIMAQKRKTAIYVYMPDVLRHAGKA
jgi:hypothetical protein